jgi:hypothetical protein
MLEGRFAQVLHVVRILKTASSDNFWIPQKEH